MDMADKGYIPNLKTGIKIAITMAIIFFVLQNVAPESIKKFFRV